MPTPMPSKLTPVAAGAEVARPITVCGGEVPSRVGALAGRVGWTGSLWVSSRRARVRRVDELGVRRALAERRRRLLRRLALVLQAPQGARAMHGQGHVAVVPLRILEAGIALGRFGLRDDRLRHGSATLGEVGDAWRRGRGCGKRKNGDEKESSAMRSEDARRHRVGSWTVGPQA